MGGRPSRSFQRLYHLMLRQEMTNWRKSAAIFEITVRKVSGSIAAEYLLSPNKLLRRHARAGTSQKDVL
jgi:hypothetical protein